MKTNENTPKKKQVKSVSYALEAMSKHLETIREANLIGDVEHETIKEHLKRATLIYLEAKFNINI